MPPSSAPQDLPVWRLRTRVLTCAYRTHDHYFFRDSRDMCTHTCGRAPISVRIHARTLRPFRRSPRNHVYASHIRMRIPSVAPRDDPPPLVSSHHDATQTRASHDVATLRIQVPTCAYPAPRVCLAHACATTSTRHAYARAHQLSPRRATHDVRARRRISTPKAPRTAHTSTHMRAHASTRVH